MGMERVDIWVSQDVINTVAYIPFLHKVGRDDDKG